MIVYVVIRYCSLYTDVMNVFSTRAKAERYIRGKGSRAMSWVITPFTVDALDNLGTVPHLSPPDTTPGVPDRHVVTTDAGND
jgi:hypothetical protein